MSMFSWFKGHGLGGSSVDSETLLEDSEPDYSLMTQDQIELRERAIHRIRKIDKLASDLDEVAVNTRSAKTTPIGNLEETSEVVWPTPNAGYDKKAFRSCLPSVPFEAQQLNTGFVVRTKVGPMRGQAGDYLVRLPNGDMCIFKEEVFTHLFRFLK